MSNRNIPQQQRHHHHHYHHHHQDRQTHSYQNHARRKAPLPQYHPRQEAAYHQDGGSMYDRNNGMDAVTRDEDELFMMKVIAARMDQPEDQNTACRSAIANLEREVMLGVAPMPLTDVLRRQSTREEHTRGGTAIPQRRRSSASTKNGSALYQVQEDVHHHPSNHSSYNDLTSSSEHQERLEEEDPVIVKVLQERSRQCSTEERHPQQYAIPNSMEEAAAAAGIAPFPGSFASAAARQGTTIGASHVVVPTTTSAKPAGTSSSAGGYTAFSSTNNNSENRRNSTEIGSDDDLEEKLERQYRAAFRASEAATPGAYASAPGEGENGGGNVRRNSATFISGPEPTPFMRGISEDSSTAAMMSRTDSGRRSSIGGSGRSLQRRSSGTNVGALVGGMDMSCGTAGAARTVVTAPLNDSQSSLSDHGQGEFPRNSTDEEAASAGKKRRLIILAVAVAMLAVVMVVVVVVVVALPSGGGSDEDPSPSTIPQLSPEESMAAFRNSLSPSTLQALEDATFVQALAMDFVLTLDPPFTSLPLWKQQQRFALAVVYYKFRGHDPPIDKDECRWLETLAACDFQTGRYEKLQLDLGDDDTWVTGLPIEVALLGDLEELTVTGKSSGIISDWLPLELVQATPKLHTLELVGLNLTGTLPSYLGDWTNLVTIDLSNNGLTGSIPTKWFSGFAASLEYWYMDENRISGSMPTEVGLLSELLKLYWRSNRLGGSIPSQLGLVGKLSELRLADNNFSGELPEELVDLQRLQVVNMKQNPNLTGQIPDGLCGTTKLGLRLQFDCDGSLQCCEKNEVVASIGDGARGEVVGGATGGR